MPANTPAGLPYPLSSDPVKDHATTVEKLAKGVQAGTTSIVVPSGSSSASVSINFPTAFTATPVVVASGTGSTWNVALNSKSTTGASFLARHIDGATGGGTVNIDWTAVGTVA